MLILRFLIHIAKLPSKLGQFTVLVTMTYYCLLGVYTWMSPTGLTLVPSTNLFS